MRRVSLSFAVVSLLVCASNPASASDFTLPENHYLVWNLLDPVSITTSLFIRDQFGPLPLDPVPYLVMEKWANPVFVKNGANVLHDPLVHHVWWKMDFVPQPVRTITVENQFGVFQWRTFEAVWLLNPADKNDAIGPPKEWPDWANHYLCYKAEGDPVDLSVDVSDQWGNWTTMALTPVYFCNPAEKTDPTGFYPIIDPKLHLTCYSVQPVSVGATFINDDQFGRRVNTATDLCLLCLPSTKDVVVRTEESTWGRIKALYRN